MMNKLYAGYGLLVVAMMGIAELRGWTMMPINELKDVPKSMRDNPGAYRSHYMFYRGYSGGK